jgi:hypothetical protein
MIANSTQISVAASSIVEAVVSYMNDLPIEQQQQVLDFVEFLQQKHVPEKPIWEKIAAIVEQAPLEVWEQVPTDGAIQHDHYLYGAPKKEV